MDLGCKRAFYLYATMSPNVIGKLFSVAKTSVFQNNPAIELQYYSVLIKTSSFTASAEWIK